MTEVLIGFAIGVCVFAMAALTVLMIKIVKEK